MVRITRRSRYSYIVTIFAALLALAGCTLQVDPTPSDLEAEAMTDPSRYGQRQNLGPQWLENVPKTLMDLATLEPPTELTEPEVLNVALAANYLGSVDVSTNAAFRWQLLVGAGGTAKQVLVDARPFQQVSVTAASLTIALLANKSFVDVAYGLPNVNVDAAALVGLGNTSTTQATYTMMRRDLGIAGLWIVSAVQIPVAASGFRLIGSTPGTAADGPFLATVIVQLNQGPFPVLQMTGLELLDTLKAGAFIPLPGGIDSLIVLNGSGHALANFGIQWGLDL